MNLLAEEKEFHDLDTASSSGVSHVLLANQWLLRVQELCLVTIMVCRLRHGIQQVIQGRFLETQRSAPRRTLHIWLNCLKRNFIVSSHVVAWSSSHYLFIPLYDASTVPVCTSLDKKSGNAPIPGNATPRACGLSGRMADDALTTVEVSVFSQDNQ